MSPHLLSRMRSRATTYPRLGGVIASVVAVLVTVTALAIAVFAAAPIPPAEAQGACNFEAPFGPDPSPNWKKTFAANPNGVEFWIHQEIANDPAWVDEILAAFDTWKAANSIINFRYMGSTSTLPQTDGSRDGINVIGDDQGVLPPRSLGSASFGGFASALQFDIALNLDSPAGIGIASVANPVGDLQSIVLHEMGHVLGLAHTPTTSQVMVATLTVGDQVHSLGTEDFNCLTQIFGSSQPAPTAVPTVAPAPTVVPIPTARPTSVPDITVNGADRPVQVMHTATCLAGNGRVDTNIVNTSVNAALYRIEFAGLSPRQNNVLSGDWWRMPITGRSDGQHQIVVRRGNTIVSNQTVTVSCDSNPPRITAPEVQVVNACRAGRGYLLFQFANASPAAKGYVIEFEGVANRSTGAAAYGATVRAVTGRANGTKDVKIRSGGATIGNFTVTTRC